LDPLRPEDLEILRTTALLDLRPDLEPYQAAALDRAIRAEAEARQAGVAEFVAHLEAPSSANFGARPSYILLLPPQIAAGVLRPGQIKDLSLVLHDKRAGLQPEGQAFSEDSRLRILQPTYRGTDVVLNLVLKVPRNSTAGRFETALLVQTADEEHIVPVSYVVEQTAPLSGCLTLLWGG
jgi:hypothetical protein